VWATAVLTAITGVGLFWTKYLVLNEDAWSVINHPLEPWFLKSHIIVSPLLIFALGLITLRHVWRHYREGKVWGRKSGITVALMAGPMIITGYLIQAVTHVGWLRALVVVHVAAGLVFAAGLALHQIFVRRRASAPADLSGAPARPFAGEVARRDSVLAPGP
jgi:hypothetical protein